MSIEESGESLLYPFAISLGRQLGQPIHWRDVTDVHALIIIASEEIASIFE